MAALDLSSPDKRGSCQQSPTSSNSTNHNFHDDMQEENSDRLLSTPHHSPPHVRSAPLFQSASLPQINQQISGENSHFRSTFGSSKPVISFPNLTSTGSSWMGGHENRYFRPHLLRNALSHKDKTPTPVYSEAINLLQRDNQINSSSEQCMHMRAKDETATDPPESQSACGKKEVSVLSQSQSVWKSTTNSQEIRSPKHQVAHAVSVDDCARFSNFRQGDAAFKKANTDATEDKETSSSQICLNDFAQKAYGALFLRFVHALAESKLDFERIQNLQESGRLMQQFGKVLDEYVNVLATMPSLDDASDSKSSPEKREVQVRAKSADKHVQDDELPRTHKTPGMYTPQQVATEVSEYAGVREHSSEQGEASCYFAVKQEPLDENPHLEHCVDHSFKDNDYVDGDLKSTTPTSDPLVSFSRMMPLNREAEEANQRNTEHHLQQTGGDVDKASFQLWPSQTEEKTSIITSELERSKEDSFNSPHRNKEPKTDQPLTFTMEAQSNLSDNKIETSMEDEKETPGFETEDRDDLWTDTDISAAEADAGQLAEDRELTLLNLRVREDEDNVKLSEDGVTVILLRTSIWRAFDHVGTEMIINRSGRRMFPFVSVQLRGLDEGKMYEVEMEVIPADNRRYKFINNVWTAVGVADAPITNCPYPHQESPNNGRHWMSREIHFTRVKLTNNRDSSEGNMLLHSMHKYVVVITVRQVQDAYSCKMLRNFRFRLNLTSFIAVTAYQNDLVTKLKIHNNPFAKAFRDSIIPTNNKKGTVRKRPVKFEEEMEKTAERQLIPAKRRRDAEIDRCGNISVYTPPASFGVVAPHVGGPFLSSNGPGPSHDRMAALAQPPPPLMWVPGVPPPWIGLGQGMIHPYYYNLPRHGVAWTPSITAQDSIYTSNEMQMNVPSPSFKKMPSSPVSSR